MTRYELLCLTLILCAGGTGKASPALGENDILGTYRRGRDGSESTMAIAKKKSGLLNVHLEGGSDGALGNQVPADCELDADGAIDGNLLNAVIRDDEEVAGKRTEKTHLRLA